MKASRFFLLVLCMTACSDSHSKNEDAAGTGGLGSGVSSGNGTNSVVTGAGGATGAAGSGENSGSSGTTAGSGENSGSIGTTVGSGGNSGSGSGGRGGIDAVAGVGGSGGGNGIGGEGGIAGSVSIPADHCLAGITGYANNGPFTFETKKSGTANMLVPKVPAGCKVPMVHHAINDTGGACDYYAAIRGRLATHGFLTLCTEVANGAQGYDEDIESFETALSEYPDLADYRFGSTGHSQAGQAAFIVVQLVEERWGDKAIIAGLAIEPSSGFGSSPPGGTWTEFYAKIKSPMFMFSGLGTDTLVSQGWVQQQFDALSDTVEAYFWAKEGANHITTVNADANEVIVPWFRWKLLGDREACEFLKAIPGNNATWTQVASQNEKPCR
ncbi:MAG: hypothetical protein JXA30_12080 [Deltaproteobacteria bacterium]|nr:hypothetical protein [Deltaproteobacteria bacterium]